MCDPAAVSSTSVEVDVQKSTMCDVHSDVVAATIEVSPCKQPAHRGKRKDIMRSRPCTRRRAPVWAHIVGSFFHFASPLITTYYLVRMVAAGNVDPTTLVLMSLILPVTILFCCGVGCCRLSFCTSLWAGILVATGLTYAVVMNDGHKLVANGVHKPNRRIGIVGGGPSGTMAAWMLAQDSPEAKIDVYEYSAKLGGHSDTIWANVSDPATGGEQSVPIDIGFIFSTPNYRHYGALTTLFNYTRQLSRISVHYHGDEAADLQPWSNEQGGAGEVFRRHVSAARADRLASEIARFSASCDDARQMSTLELLTPLATYLWYHGYSNDFFESALKPMMTPLFVTQHGNSAQSAGATCGHFNKQRGFLSFNVSDHPDVYHTVGGVQFMYEKMLQQVTGLCANCSVMTNTEVVSVAPSIGGWTITSRDRASGDVRAVEYDEVVLACNAHIGERLLAAGGDGQIGEWPSCDDDDSGRAACRRGWDNVYRALRSWAMRNTEYEWSDVTLTRASADQAEANSSSLYHIWKKGVMTGSIDKILGLVPPTQGTQYRLRVAPSIGDASPDDVAPDINPVLARRRWQHHRFNLWEHLLVMRILVHFNNYDGLHVAGDWTSSVGQEAALDSGVRSACAIGLKEETKQALVALGINIYKSKAC